MKENKLTNLGKTVLPALLLLLACALGIGAWRCEEQRREIIQQEQQENARLQKVLQFKNEHRDYAAVLEQEKSKLLKLQQYLPQQLDENELLKEVQQLADKNYLRVREMKPLSPDERKTQNGKQEQEKLLMQGVKLAMQGDYYDFLVWLRQLERAQYQLRKVKLSSSEQQEQLEIDLEVVKYLKK